MKQLHAISKIFYLQQALTGIVSHLSNRQYNLTFHERADKYGLYLALLASLRSSWRWYTVWLNTKLLFRAFTNQKRFFEKKAYHFWYRILLGLDSPSKPEGGGKESPPSSRMMSSLWRLRRIRLLNEKLCLFPTLFIQKRLITAIFEIVWRRRYISNIYDSRSEIRW